jgi:hypothetical protein
MAISINLRRQRSPHSIRVSYRIRPKNDRHFSPRHRSNIHTAAKPSDFKNYPVLLLRPYVVRLFLFILLYYTVILSHINSIFNTRCKGYNKTVPVTHVTLGSHVHANTVILDFMFLKGLMMTSCKSKHVA